MAAARRLYEAPDSGELRAEDFFTDRSGAEHPTRRRAYVNGTSAVELAPEVMPRPRRRTAGRPSGPAKRAKETRPARAVRRSSSQAQVLTLRQLVHMFVEAHDMARVKSKFNFFLFIGVALAGCLALVVMYARVYSQQSELNMLKEELSAAQETNEIAKQTIAEGMTMNDLYIYAVGSLGMVEADAGTTIRIKVQNQSYTTSNLPVQEIPKSKVTFHWFD